jgi:hypothetical protein
VALHRVTVEPGVDSGRVTRGGASRKSRDPAWKDFYIRNPWVPFRILKEKFGILPYDLSNFRGKPQCQEIIGDSWTLGKEQTPERVQAIITAAFTYYVTHEIGVADLTSEASIQKILHLNKSRVGSFSFIWEKRNLENLPGFREWIARGYTYTSFLFLNIFPGQEWAARTGVLPVMFSQTSTTAV